jgi:hypothetical protein
MTEMTEQDEQDDLQIHYQENMHSPLNVKQLEFLSPIPTINKDDSINMFDDGKRQTIDDIIIGSVELHKNHNPSFEDMPQMLSGENHGIEISGFDFKESIGPSPNI